MEIRDWLYVVYCVWIIGMVFPFKAAFFAFTVPHALLSAICGLIVGIMSVFYGTAIPIYLLPFFLLEISYLDSLSLRLLRQNHDYEPSLARIPMPRCP